MEPEILLNQRQIKLLERMYFNSKLSNYLTPSENKALRKHYSSMFTLKTYKCRDELNVIRMKYIKNVIR